MPIFSYIILKRLNYLAKGTLTLPTHCHFHSLLILNFAEFVRPKCHSVHPFIEQTQLVSTSKEQVC